MEEIVIAFPQEIQSVIDQGLIQAQSDILQKVATVTADFTAPFRVEPIQPMEDLVMGNDSLGSLFLGGHWNRGISVLEVGADDGIECLIGVGEDGFMNNIPHIAKERL